MKKKVFSFLLAVCLMFPVAFMLTGCNEKKILKTELNGVVFESNSFNVSTWLEQEDEDDYKFFLKGAIRLSITNTNAIPFTFQAGAFGFKIGGDYPFNFYSLKDTSTDFETEENTDAVTITANTQTVFELEFRYRDSSIRASDTEALVNEIDEQIERLGRGGTNDQGIQAKSYSFEATFLTNKIIQSRINVSFYSAQQLIDWCL